PALGREFGAVGRADDAAVVDAGHGRSVPGWCGSFVIARSVATKRSRGVGSGLLRCARNDAGGRRYRAESSEKVSSPAAFATAPLSTMSVAAARSGAR